MPSEHLSFSLMSRWREKINIMKTFSILSFISGKSALIANLSVLIDYFCFCVKI